MHWIKNAEELFWFPTHFYSKHWWIQRWNVSLARKGTNGATKIWMKGFLQKEGCIAKNKKTSGIEWLCSFSKVMAFSKKMAGYIWVKALIFQGFKGCNIIKKKNEAFLKGLRKGCTCGTRDPGQNAVIPSVTTKRPPEFVPVIFPSTVIFSAPNCWNLL